MMTLGKHGDMIDICGMVGKGQSRQVHALKPSMTHEWTQRELRPITWNLHKTKQWPDTQQWREAEEQVVMLNDIMHDLIDVNKDEIREVYQSYPVRGLINKYIHCA